MSLARRSLQVVAFICTLIVGVTAMAVIVTQTAWFKDWLRGFIVRQADDYVNGRLSIGRLDGNLFFGVELDDVDVTMNGKTVVNISNIGLDYNAFTFFRGDVVLDDIRLSRPVLRLERTADGWNLAQLIKARTPEEPNNRRTLEIGEIGISDGTLYFDGEPVGTTGISLPSRIDGLDASVGVKSNEDELTVDIAHVSMRTVEPSVAVQTLSGVIRRTKDMVALDGLSIRTGESSLSVEGTIGNIEDASPIVDLKASSDKLGFDEIARIVPALRGYHIHPAFEIAARGPAERMSVDVNVRDKDLGKMTGALTVDAMAPQRRVAGKVSLDHFNFGPLVPAKNDRPSAGAPVVKSDITGEARIDLALPSERLPLSGTYSVNAGRVQVAGYEARNVVGKGRIDGSTIQVDAVASAYGGEASAAGTVKTGEQLALDLRGTASNIDLRNLPEALSVPAVESNLRLAYALMGRGSRFSGDVKLDASTLAGAMISPGTTATFSVGQGAPQYSAKGNVVALDLQQIGQGFEIAALAEDRYRSRVNASFDVTGAGGGRYPLTLDATGTIVDSEVFGASFPRLDFTTALADGDARIKTVGAFANLDPAVVSGNDRIAGMVAGTVDVETTLRDYAEGVTVDSIDLAGRVNLDRSTVAAVTIDVAGVEGHYANREGDLTRLAVMGPDGNVQAHGPIALTEDGSTNLTLHADTSSLDRIGKIVGQPLKGSAVVDATVTGNARSLDVQGMLKGSDVGHGENGALSLASDFVATIPDLTPADATVKAKSMVTFLEVGGQKITELAADVTYTQSKLDFQATAQEGVRQLEAAGSVIFHPDHQEIHLPNLVLRSEQIEWRSAPGSEAAVQYTKDRVAVENVQLVNGDQRISANGVLGSTTEPLQVRIENLDVAQVDRLLLGDQRLAGRLSADAMVTGPLSEPRAEGQFTLAQGAFRSYKYESLSGNVGYVGKGVNIDIRLQQTPTEWLAAKGYAPLTLFRATPEGRQGGHQEAEPGDAVDIDVSSSQINLGLVQGFTSYVTDVTGVMQANLKVSGSGYDPHFDGAVEIRGGAFAVPELGTRYTKLDTRIDLNGEGLSIQQFKILDARGFPMTVGGTLALHAREVGAVDVKIESQKFEVIDNKLADLKLNTDIRITGEVRKPRIEGFVEIENGTIHVAELLERVTSDPYATESTELPAEGAATKPQVTSETAQAPAPQPSVFDALDMDLGLSIPGNLVLRGNDIRAANAPVAIGDVNLTVGGVLQIRKAPSDTLRLVGDVNTVRGTYTFQGRRFDIMRDGRIGFSGGDEIDPLLDVKAKRVISAVETYVTVRGTMKMPELSFSSVPPLAEADVLALIVFNQPINELGEGQQASLAQQAGALAGGYLTSGLARSIGNALELDEFEIQAQGAGGAGPSLSVGEQVGRNLFFRLRQAFGSEQTTEVILEYQIRDYLRFQGSVAEGTTEKVQFRRVERAGLDLIFFFSY